MAARPRFLVVSIALLLMAVGFGLGSLVTAARWQPPPPSVSDLLTRLGVNRPADWQSFERVWDSIHASYLKPDIQDRELIYGATAGLVEALGDPYSVFLDPDASEEFQQEIEGTFEGIGMEVGIKDEQLTVVAPLPDSPAARGGMKAGDVILVIDGRDARSMSLTEAVQAIRGPSGSSVTLEIERNGEMKEFRIKRETIRIESVISRTETESGKTFGYIQISHFTSDTERLFQRAGRDLLDQSIDGLILDLRNNPGGLLDESLKVTSAFLADKVLVKEVDRAGRTSERRSQGSAWLADPRLVVLVNEGSASAAEIVAGALQDHKRGVVIGQPTYGKGSVQDFQILPDGSSLKLTIAAWLTPNGRSIDEQGIEPDEAVDQPDSDETDVQLERAKAILANP